MGGDGMRLSLSLGGSSLSLSLNVSDLLLVDEQLLLVGSLLLLELCESECLLLLL